MAEQLNPTARFCVEAFAAAASKNIQVVNTPQK
jgi:hypothetical protein